MTALHRRIAIHLGWSERDVTSFSLSSLRELVTDPDLRADITAEIARIHGMV